MAERHDDVLDPPQATLLTGEKDVALGAPIVIAKAERAAAVVVLTIVPLKNRMYQIRFVSVGDANQISLDLMHMSKGCFSFWLVVRTTCEW